jgi:hypothetical protein
VAPLSITRRCRGKKLVAAMAADKLDVQNFPFK